MQWTGPFCIGVDRKSRWLGLRAGGVASSRRGVRGGTGFVAERLWRGETGDRCVGRASYSIDHLDQPPLVGLPASCVSLVSGVLFALELNQMRDVGLRYCNYQHLPSRAIFYLSNCDHWILPPKEASTTSVPIIFSSNFYVKCNVTDNYAQSSEITTK